jgi:hypothetical protein
MPIIMGGTLMSEQSFDDDPITLAVMIAGLRSALVDTLLALARQHGNQAGPWLDELHETTTRKIKAGVTEGISLDAEAGAFSSAIEMVDGVFAQLKRALIEHNRG